MFDGEIIGIIFIEVDCIFNGLIVLVLLINEIEEKFVWGFFF